MNKVILMVCLGMILVLSGCKQDKPGKTSNENTSNLSVGNVEDQTLVWIAGDKTTVFEGTGAYGEHENLHRMYLNFTHGSEGMVLSLTNFRGQFLGKHELTDQNTTPDQSEAVIRLNSSGPDGPSIFISKLCNPTVGYLEITSFDPVLNLVSGRFEADLCSLNMYAEEPDKRNTKAEFKNIQLSSLLR